MNVEDVKTIALVTVAIERSGLEKESGRTSAIHNRLMELLERQQRQIDGLINQARSLDNQLKSAKADLRLVLEQRDNYIEQLETFNKVVKQRETLQAAILEVHDFAKMFSAADAVRV